MAEKHTTVTINGRRYPTTHITEAGNIAKTKKGYYVDQYGSTKKLPKTKKNK